MINYFKKIGYNFKVLNYMVKNIFTHKVAIKLWFLKSVAQKRLKSNMEFRYQIIVGDPTVREKSRKNEKNQGQGKVKVSKGAKIRNRYNQVPQLTQDTNGKVTNSQ